MNTIHHPTPRLLIAAATAALLAACGGGGGGDDGGGGSSAADAQGLYLGGTEDGRDVTGLVLDDGRYYFLYTRPGTSTPGGVVQGTGSSGGGRFTSGDARDFSIQAQDVYSASIDATYTARQHIGGTLDYGGGERLRFSVDYSSDWEEAPDTAALAGSYAGSVYSSDGVESARTTVRSDGSFDATGASGCRASGRFVPRPQGNAFDATITFGGAPCLFGTQRFAGAAYFDADARRLYMAAPNAARDDGVLFVGTR